MPRSKDLQVFCVLRGKAWRKKASRSFGDTKSSTGKLRFPIPSGFRAVLWGGVQGVLVPWRGSSTFEAICHLERSRGDRSGVSG